MALVDQVFWPQWLEVIWVSSLLSEYEVKGGPEASLGVVGRVGQAEVGLGARVSDCGRDVRGQHWACRDRPRGLPEGTDVGGGRGEVVDAHHAAGQRHVGRVVRDGRGRRRRRVLKADAA